MSGIATTRAQRRALKAANAREPATLRLVPLTEWPPHVCGIGVLRVWRSRDFLVQEHPAPEPAIARLSVNRTVLDGDRWADGITWDELQAIKAQCGYGNRDAVEVYPSARDEVNVANMRHLWILWEPLAFAWRRRVA